MTYYRHENNNTYNGYVLIKNSGGQEIKDDIPKVLYRQSNCQLKIPYPAKISFVNVP